MNVIKDKKDANKVTGVIIDGASFYYTRIRQPSAIFDDRDVKFEKARKEYKVDVAVTEDVADAWDEIFKKQPSKKHTNKQFADRYKLDSEADLPFPDQKKQFTIKVTQKELNADGEPMSVPRVFVTENGKPVDITFDKNVGNGSVGKIKVKAISNKYGSFAYLDKILLSDLVEYEGGEGGLSEEDKDFLGTDDVELAEAPARKPSKVSDEDDFGDAGGSAGGDGVEDGDDF